MVKIRARIVKPFAFIGLLAATGLVAQVVELGNLCSEKCHQVGTAAYNTIMQSETGTVEQAHAAGSAAMEACLYEMLC